MKEYTLETELTFGKHSGINVKQIIEGMPDYINWAILNLDHFYLDEESMIFLQEKYPVIETTISTNQEKAEDDIETYTSPSYYDEYDYPSPSSNPHYNDDMDMDQQSVEFWDSL